MATLRADARRNRGLLVHVAAATERHVAVVLDGVRARVGELRPGRAITLDDLGRSGADG